jgi:DNA-binding response OmpR family regulator
MKTLYKDFALWSDDLPVFSLASAENPRFRHGLNCMSKENVTSRGRILLVDDDEGVRTLVEKLLEKCGYSVTSVGLAQQCLERLSESTFDLILLDHILPDMDGLLLLQLVRDRLGKSQKPVVYLTGIADDTTKRRAFEIGVDDYVIKPFDPGDFMARVSRQIRLNGSA